MTKKKGIIRVSPAPMGGYISKPFNNSIRMNDVNVSMELSKQNSAGASLPRDSFPEEIYGLHPDKHVKKLPDSFNTHGYRVISEATAEVLQQFDLGAGGLYPVKVFQHNRTKRVGSEYFCWNFGNVKNCSCQRALQRWSQDFVPVVKMDRLMRKTIQNDETKEPLA